MKNSNKALFFSGDKIATFKDLLLMIGVSFTIVFYFIIVDWIGNISTPVNKIVYNVLFSVGITIILYTIFRIMFKLLNIYFPWNESILKRLLIEVPAIFIISISVMILYSGFWSFCTTSEGMSLFSNITIAVIVSLLLNTIFEGIQLFRLYKESLLNSEILKRQNIESHFETLKNQVAPHFLFNSLNTLIALIDDNTEKAKEFVEHLAAYYRYALQVTNEDKVSIKTEMNLVENYIFLLKCRFDKNFEVKFNIDEAIKSKDIIPLSIQLLIENAVKHNVISKSKPLIIEINNDKNYLIIKNNLQKKDALEMSNQIGLNNINSRFEIIFNKSILIEESANYFTVKLPI
jgi:sensor histidine kinase YesM